MDGGRGPGGHVAEGGGGRDGCGADESGGASERGVGWVCTLSGTHVSRDNGGRRQRSSRVMGGCGDIAAVPVEVGCPTHCGDTTGKSPQGDPYGFGSSDGRACGDGTLGHGSSQAAVDE